MLNNKKHCNDIGVKCAYFYINGSRSFYMAESNENVQKINMKFNFS